MKRPLAFLLATVCLDMLGLGLVVPIAPALVTAITGHADSAARWSGLIDSSYGVLQFLAAPLLGRVADRYGRRPVLVVSVTLLGIDFLGHGAATHVWQLLAVHALAGLFAGNGIAVNAYIADITTPDRRARAFGLLGMAASVGFIAGPAIGGLLGAVSLRLPFAIAGTLALANGAIGWFVLPESRPGDRRTSLSWRVTNPVSAVAALLRHPALGRLALARMGRDVARLIDQAILVFFMMTQFDWSTAHVGFVLAANAALSGVVSGSLSGRVITRFGARTVALWCSGLDVATYVGFALARSGVYAYPLLVTGVLAGMAGTALATLIANASGTDEQGSVQGALGGVGALAEAIVPVAALTLFATTLRAGWPGAGFALAGVALAASALAIRTPRPVPADDESLVTVV